MVEGEVTITLTRTEALALERAADVGVRVIEALQLTRTTSTMDKALERLRNALR